jgi:hypothetical protein
LRRPPSAAARFRSEVACSISAAAAMSGHAPLNLSASRCARFL